MKTALRASGLGGLALVFLGLAVGCGDSGPRVVQVSGKVTRGGKPVSGLLVHFQPETGRASFGRTDDQGNYTLEYDKTRKGAVVGTHRVFVQFKGRGPLDEEKIARGEFHPDQKAIMEKYGSLEVTKLRVEVGPDGNQDIPIKLD